jgi:hypothetical protein
MPPHQGKFIAYFRVSTDKQGKSGLGLEAQRKAALDYLNCGRWSLMQEFVEIESGKHNERPQLAAALAAYIGRLLGIGRCALSPPPALRKSRHRGLARGRVAMDRRATLVVLEACIHIHGEPTGRALALFQAVR